MTPTKLANSRDPFPASMAPTVVTLVYCASSSSLHSFISIHAVLAYIKTRETYTFITLVYSLVDLLISKRVYIVVLAHVH
jgi:hypothetical protein